MSKKLGFIGMGNMAHSIALGALKAGFLKGNKVLGYDPFPAKLEELAQRFGVQKAESAGDVARQSDIIVLAVKPNTIKQVLEEITEAVTEKAVASIALGWQFEQLNAVLQNSARIQAVMPNTPMEVGEGICLFEQTNTLKQDELSFLKGLFESVGIVRVLPTNLMGIGGTLSGCGPAFAYMFIEALADGAVQNGLPRADAYSMAAQMLLGSAKMVLEAGVHPAQLKDNVCSPGGSTIRGVAALEEKGLRAAAIAAINASNAVK